MKLVKDFDDYQITYYWLDSEGIKVSPNLPTLVHAQEWYLEHNFAQYDGIERRQRKCERRHANTLRTTLRCKRKNSSSGRRSTDKTFSVDIDFSKDKIKKVV